jgi:DNA-binding PadR family transcriptional regulator
VRTEVSRRLERDCALGAIYTTLQRLEEKGFVRSWTSSPTPVRGGRSKRCYKVTAVGARALATAREARERLWKGIGPSWTPA